MKIRATAFFMAVLSFTCMASAQVTQATCDADKAAATADLNIAKGYGGIALDSDGYYIDDSDVTRRDYAGHYIYVMSTYTLTQAQVDDVNARYLAISSYWNAASTDKSAYRSDMSSGAVSMSQGNTYYSGHSWYPADTKYCDAYSRFHQARADYTQWGSDVANAQQITNDFFTDYP